MFNEFLERHVATVEPLARDLRLAYWDATTTGRAEDFKRFADLEVELQKVYASESEFARLRRWREGGVDDELEQRQLDRLYHAYLRYQADPALMESITRLSTDILNRFNVYRARVDGREMTSNEVRDVLRAGTDTGRRRAVWEADKGVGRVVRDDLLELVRLRNRAATSLGFDDYYTMSMELSEQDVGEVFDLFDRLEELTREPFAAMKQEVDAALAERFGIRPDEIMPWHYSDPFFQEAPRISEVDLDAFYKGRDILNICRRFFEGMGLEVAPVLDRSDLYEKPGKEQHAYCMDIDRRGDVRVLANIADDENWTGTMLHELGHAVYDVYIDPSLPYLLREHAHIFVTEAIAMLFGRLSKDLGWIGRMTGAHSPEGATAAVERNQRLAQLVFARWCQVMVRFERELYRDPEQDLDRLWWDIVERMQMVRRPPGRSAPDWASKIHVVSAPVYYHNYMLGELLASQLEHVLQDRVLGTRGRDSVCGRPEAGEFLRDRVFAHGGRYRWDRLIRAATGQPLSPDYYVKQFVD